LLIVPIRDAIRCDDAIAKDGNTGYAGIDASRRPGVDPDARWRRWRWKKFP